jgi:hypothetical protein
MLKSTSAERTHFARPIGEAATSDLLLYTSVLSQLIVYKNVANGPANWNSSVSLTAAAFLANPFRNKHLMPRSKPSTEIPDSSKQPARLLHTWSRSRSIWFKPDTSTFYLRAVLDRKSSRSRIGQDTLEVEVMPVLRRKTKTGGEARAVQSAPASSRMDTHESIARRAYELYEMRGDLAGDPVRDWLMAEAEILALTGTGTNEAANANGADTTAALAPAQSKPRKKTLRAVTRKIALRPRSQKEDYP